MSKCSTEMVIGMDISDKKSEICIMRYDNGEALHQGQVTNTLEGLKEEQAYLDHWLKQCEEADGELRSPVYEAAPYQEGFGEVYDEEFIFIDEYEHEDEPVAFRRFRKPKPIPFDGTYWLISPKSLHALNSQYVRSEAVYLSPEAGFRVGERVRLSNEYGTLILPVVLSEDVRSDCVLVYVSTPGVNRLTPPILSEEGDGACYQEVKVRVEKV